MRNALVVLSERINRCTEIVLVPIVLFFTIILIISVVSRYVFHIPITTSSELTRLAFVWACFLGAVIGVKRGTHVRVTALVEYLPYGLQQGCRLLILLLMGSFGGLMVYYGTHLTNRMWLTYFPTLDISQGWLYLALPVSGALIIVHVLSDMADPERQVSDPVDENREAAP